MRHSFFSALLVGSVSAATIPLPSSLPKDHFPPNPFVKPLSLAEVEHTIFYKNDTPAHAPTQGAADGENVQSLAAATTCSNPRIRWEWDSANDNTKQAFIDGIKCLMSRPPSGIFSNAKNRYEDLVALHQFYTPNVHGNSIFLIWHRYYIWIFEDIMRSECGYTDAMVWFDETRYAGRWHESSIFSDRWFGSFKPKGFCVVDGQFANITLNVGPGKGNQPHCLARDGDENETKNTASVFVDGCNRRTDYADMAACQEGGAHMWGHNGLGMVGRDVYGSPGDPIFFLHHFFVEHNLRIWQNADPARLTNIDGNDKFGNRLTLDTWVEMNNIRPRIQIRDLMDTMNEKLCYKYNY